MKTKLCTVLMVSAALSMFLPLFVGSSLAGEPSDAGEALFEPGPGQQPYFDLLHISEAWEICRGDPSCLVGVVDTGFDFFHPALDGNLLPGYFAPGVFHTNSYGMLGHGTSVASLIVARHTETEGLVGFAPECRALAASIGMPEHKLVKMQHAFAAANPNATMSDFQQEMVKHTTELKDFGRTWIDYVTRTTAEGIRYLVDHDARVINMSAFLGKQILMMYPEFATRLDEAFAYAHDHDVVVVLGAGNSATEVIDYPGSAESVIIAGACTLAGERWEEMVEHRGLEIKQGTCFGPRLGVMAPMDNIPAAVPHEKAFYEIEHSPMGRAEDATFKGAYEIHATGATSMATPIVASLVALVRSLRPELPAAEVVAIIEQGAVDMGEPGRDPMTGCGRVDFLKTLELARNWRSTKSAGAR